MPGNRGRPPKGEFTGKSSVFTTRIRPALRVSLERSAAGNGRSLSQEIERRLNDSFQEEGRMEDRFGSRENYWLMRVIGIALQDTRVIGHNAKNWRSDPVLFDVVRQTVVELLDSLRPKDPIPRQGNKQRVLAEYVTKQMPIAIWGLLSSADPSLPFNEGTNNNQLASRLKRELGTIIDEALRRAEANMPNEDEWRERGRIADEADWASRVEAPKRRKDKP